MNDTVTLYKPDCISNYYELHAKHEKFLHVHTHSLRVFQLCLCEENSQFAPHIRNPIYDTSVIK